MPIYDYRCKKCAYEFEELVLDRYQAVKCRRCQSEAVEKLASLFSCTTVRLNKRLKMESEERMKKGMEKVKKEKFRKKRIKIM